MAGGERRQRRLPEFFMGESFGGGVRHLFQQLSLPRLPRLKPMQWGIWLCLILVALSGRLDADEATQLTSQDVPRVMKQLLDYHVSVKEVTPDLLVRAYSIYLDQFDPLRLYLLQSEVAPYLESRSDRLDVAMVAYERGDLSEFVALDKQLQLSIDRSRIWRRQLGNDVKQWLLLEVEVPPIAVRPTPPYASSEEELKERQRQQMYLFARRHLPNAKELSERELDNRLKKIWSLYNRRLQGLENPYLSRDIRGVALNSPEREHQLSVRVLKAMSMSLDAHSAYFSPSEASSMRMQLQKGFTGIGVVLEDGLGGVTVARVIEGGPAFANGELLVNDTIVAVDGESIVSEPFEDVMERIRGPQGSTVELVVQREGEGGEPQVVSVSLKRDQVTLETSQSNAYYEFYGDGVIGVIRLDSFYEGDSGVSSERLVRNAIVDFRKAGPLQGIVLDLRENLGGFLSQAIRVAGLFITNGVIAMSKYSDGATIYFRDVDGYSFFEGPIVVLTSRASASAAEIVAQALQDYGKAIVVGDPRTYGKGSIQHQTITDERADSFFKVTVGRYYTVSGKSTQITGVKADIIVPTRLYEEDIGEEYLEYPLAGDTIAPAFDDPLDDVDPTIRRWFAKYYLPTLQRRSSLWADNLEVLQRNSAHRLQSSRSFQSYLDMLHENAVTGTDSPSSDDLCLKEGLNVLKDMIYLQSKQQGAAAKVEPVVECHQAVAP